MKKQSWLRSSKLKALAFLVPFFIFSSSYAGFGPKTCQFLLAPTKDQFNDYFTDQIIEFSKRSGLTDLEHTADTFSYDYAQDLLLVGALAPLNYFYEFELNVWRNYDSRLNLSIRKMSYNDSFDRVLFRMFSELVFSHKAGFNERREILKKIVRREFIGDEPIRFSYFDELIGLNKIHLENKERLAFSSSIPTPENSIDISTENGVGLGAKHDLWFTNHQTLFLQLIEASARKTRRIVDLGTGTGRLGLMAGFLFPKIQFVGLEIYGPRVRAAQQAAERFGFADRIQFREQDLLDISKEIPVADFYYIFGPTNSSEINNQVIDRLFPIAQKNKIVISSTLRLTTSQLGQRSWLSEIQNNLRRTKSVQFTNGPR